MQPPTQRSSMNRSRPAKKTTVVEIDDPDDPRFRQFRLNERGLASRADKRDDAGAGLFLAEGDLVVERAIAAGCRPLAALVDIERVPDVAAALECPVYGGGYKVRQVVSRLGVPLSIVTLFHRPSRPTVAELAANSNRLVVVEAVDNPTNIGSIIRNAAALGWEGLVLDHTSADPLARRSLRVGMGTVFSLPHARTPTLAADLQMLDDFELYAMTPSDGAVSLNSIDPGPRVAVLIGSERSGLSEEVLSIATPVQIPMADGVDSLNAAAATAVACYALRA
jgi:tRNA G18 (ribose-2'-O)-methylase SpoU